MTDATPIDISNSTVFYVSDLVVTNNLKVQVSAPTAVNVIINNRAILVVH